MKKFLIMMMFAAAFGNAALAADANESSQAARVAQLEQERDTLKADLKQIDSEMSRCKKQNKNWKTATIVGGIGVAATATGAVIQHSSNKGKREEQGKLAGELEGHQEALKKEQGKL